MTKINSYLNFPGNTEKAFNFYRAVFGGEFTGIMRFKHVEDFPGKEQMSEEALNGIMNIQLPIGDNILMGTDTIECMGQQLKTGTNITLSIHPENKEEADRIYQELSRDGKASMPMTDMFWGDYWGSLTDKFGIQWMVNFHKAAGY